VGFERARVFGGPEDWELIRRAHAPAHFQALFHARGITDERLIDAFCSVPREAFVPPHLADVAYADEALAIGMGQTISQPSLVAETIAALRLSAGHRVLEVGTGSGYVAALLAHLVESVDTVERIPELYSRAVSRLRELGPPFDKVRVHLHDGSTGFAANAPYDAIIVSAGAPHVPDALIDQLVPRGRLVVPVGAALTDQRLVCVTKHDDGHCSTEDLGPVRFVPLIGADGWRE
jgi:protein-L-isoaspartate(D-aspartate) O-methyltransferase